MNEQSIYTKSERTERKYTVHQAVMSVKRRLKDKSIGICVNALRHRSDDEKITLEELNRLADAIYQDTIYYAYA